MTTDNFTEAEYITIPRPHVPHGPKGIPAEQADADYLREAARKLEEHYKPFGSNLRAAVVELVRDAADAVGGPRTHLAAQRQADAAQIIDEHRTTGRWVGDGVRVECTCGHISPGSHPGGPQTAEDNAHRDADRKHAAHVADMLARAARRDEEER